MNGDRTPSIIERALQKHTIDTDKSDKYLLVQLLPDGSKFTISCKIRLLKITQIKPISNKTGQ